MPKVVKITQASNGFIVDIIDSGQSIFKDPYEKGRYVFTEFVRVEEYLEGFFEPKEKKK